MTHSFTVLGNLAALELCWKVIFERQQRDSDAHPEPRFQITRHPLLEFSDVVRPFENRPASRTQVLHGST
ncbi:hypothetical protein [Gordonia polyisoprenivorans]|uniref:hypothetical protein n=1 Tax=Gordonia polyisoprenivorans TaxID=84595 RepID=UPI001AD6C976|nr:hypothetical protein [Gordonia polyisoprenivorans]QTI70908.1 hypothetical protein J6U32_10490 [Gordonia polyisoprenivorans]